MATDLNLHRKSAMTSPDTAEGKARDIEVHNRKRTWILCFCLDRSFSAQMGKPHTIQEESVIFSPYLSFSDASEIASSFVMRSNGVERPLPSLPMPQYVLMW